MDIVAFCQFVDGMFSVLTEENRSIEGWDDIHFNNTLHPKSMQALFTNPLVREWEENFPEAGSWYQRGKLAGHEINKTYDLIRREEEALENHTYEQEFGARDMAEIASYL